MDANDDEYTNAAAAHAAFVVTVSVARMYWLLRHAQQGRNHWVIGEVRTPKIWTDHRNFFDEECDYTVT